MRKFTLAFALLMSTFAVKAQVVATFDTFSLLVTTPDTFYLNYSEPLEDVGFSDGQGYFPCAYDTAFTGYWVYGFAYSNMTDSVTDGFANEYSAKTAIGYDNSAGYCVSYQGYGVRNYIKITDTAAAGDTVMGFYITNSTYAYNAMNEGYFSAKKFGGLSGNDPDWFKLTVYGYLDGQLKTDTVDYYLADFRFANNADDYIVNTWEWLDLTALGSVDSLEFLLSSTDTAGGFGMNNPTYFCMDDFTTKTTTPVGLNTVAKTNAAKLYPNPATETLYVEVNNPAIKELKVMDVTGKLVLSQSVSTNKEAINISSLPSGTYYLQLVSDTQTVGARFVKQ